MTLSSIFPRFTCDVCKTKIFDLLNRYHCLQCRDFDICVNCFAKKSFTGSHTASHPLQEFCPCQLIVVDNGEIKEFRCNSCKGNIGKDGKRYHCLECFDVDMCESCYTKQNHVKEHKSSHKLQLFTYSTGVAFPDNKKTETTPPPNTQAAKPEPAKTEPTVPEVSLSLMPNPLGGFTLTTNSIGVEVLFGFLQETKKRTVFVDRNITEGIYHLTIKIKYGAGQKNSALDMGVAHSDTLKQCYDKTLGEIAGSCCLGFGVMDGHLVSVMDGVKDNEKSLSAEHTVPDGSLVGAELDSVAHTLSFFVDGKKFPHAISSVKNPVYFGIDGAGYSSFVAVSLRRLSAATPSDVKTVSFVCKPK